MEKRTIGMIGGGRVARILLTGWARSGGFAGSVRVYDKNPAVAEELEKILPGQVIFGSPAEAAGCDLVLLALHPPVLLETLTSLKAFLKPGNLVVSLGPKVTMAAMQSVLGGSWPLARVNPSAPGIVNAGLNPLCFNEQAIDRDRRYLVDLFALLGSAKIVPEEKLEAYALISAMGPTYFWFQWDYLRELAIQFGFDAKESEETIESMVRGAVETLFHSGLPAGQVMNLVPAKPLGEREPAIKSFYTEHLNAMYTKIRPASGQTGV